MSERRISAISRLEDGQGSQCVSERVVRVVDEPGRSAEGRVRSAVPGCSGEQAEEEGPFHGWTDDG